MYIVSPRYPHKHPDQLTIGYTQHHPNCHPSGLDYKAYFRFVGELYLMECWFQHNMMMRHMPDKSSYYMVYRFELRRQVELDLDFWNNVRRNDRR